VPTIRRRLEAEGTNLKNRNALLAHYLWWQGPENYHSHLRDWKPYPLQDKLATPQLPA
jgi:hypothetical protein